MTGLTHRSSSTALGVVSQTGYLCSSAVIENRPGAGTNIATEVVVRTAADGYTAQKLLSEPGFRAGAAPRPRLMPPKEFRPIIAGRMGGPS